MRNEAKKIRVVELFAGVGGFRIGLERASSNYKIVWSNQWEPSTKTQDASEIYVKKFGSENHSNKDIGQVKISDIPDHEMLVGGFPCQDYSVARTLNQAAGLIGKKGVLWWEIERIIREKKIKPKYLLLENVDRLLKSPAKQRGRDFAIMLSSLASHDYIVEWRVINAADYGMPQRRRRVFIFAYHKSCEIYASIERQQSKDWISENGTIAKAFPIKNPKFFDYFELSNDLEKLTSDFNINGKLSPFKIAGILKDGIVTTSNVEANFKGKHITLGDVLEKGKIPSNFYIDSSTIERWKYLKGAKNEQRTNKSNGFTYKYSEGGMIFPDPLDKPSRTIITAEGGNSPSRFKHVIKTEDGLLRRLTPVELERLNMFPDNHTFGVSDQKRAFFMGNALVVGIVEKLSKSLLEMNEINSKECVDAI